ncbi:MAG TPA: hypothetical protein VFQ43_13225 [Nitrososphaera sp.]|nr:hypothetical protein [Nitrososphaera sp.]
MPPRSPAQGFREAASDNRKADQHCCSDPHLHIAAPLDLANDAALAVSRREDSQVVDSQTPNRLDAGALLASLSGRCQAFYRVLPAIRARANGLWRACSARYLRPIQLWEGSKGRSLYVALTPLAVPP